MSSYQKLKIENKFLWWYINEIVTQYALAENPNNAEKASEEAQKAIAWGKYQVKQLQSHETK